jgi:hypothetical protein
MSARFITATVMMHSYGCCMATAQATQYCLAVTVKTSNRRMGKDFRLKQLPSFI